MLLLKYQRRLLLLEQAQLYMFGWRKTEYYSKVTEFGDSLNLPVVKKSVTLEVAMNVYQFTKTQIKQFAEFLNK